MEKPVECYVCHLPYNHKNHAIGGDHRLVLPPISKCLHPSRAHIVSLDKEGKWADRGWECEDCEEKTESPIGMKAGDRIGVLQTHNQKGESCGVILRVEDLDIDVRKTLVPEDANAE